MRRVRQCAVLPIFSTQKLIRKKSSTQRCAIVKFKGCCNLRARLYRRRAFTSVLSRTIRLSLMPDERPPGKSHITRFIRPMSCGALTGKSFVSAECVILKLEYIYNKTVINGSKSYLNNPASLNDFVNSFARFFRSHLAQNPIPLSLTSCKNKSNPLIGIELIRRKSSISAFVFINHFE